MGLFKINIFRLWLLPFATCLLPILSLSQSPSIQTTVNKSDILIGEQLKLTIKANFKPGIFRVNWLSVPDSIPHFDIVDKGNLDSSTYKDNSKSIQQTIIFTSFDSGKWTIPSFRINFDPLIDDTTINLFSDTVRVNVSYSRPDSTNQLRDIKPIIDVSITDYTWYYFAGGIIVLLLIGYFIWRYLKKKKKDEPAIIVESKLSPYDEAMEELQKLDRYDLQNTAELKAYHTKLADIFKRYLGRKQNKDLTNYTTGDLLIKIKETELSHENISSLATALRCSDAVKFAKYQPGSIESNECYAKIKEIINTIEHATHQPLNP